jgi:multidrug efflux pump
VNFSGTFIRRPVLSTVVSLLILLLGAQGFASMQIRQYPEVQETTITVTTAYPGASADLIQGFITDPIAKAVSSTEDVDYVTASSMQSVSNVSVRMKLGADPDKALTEVMSKVQGVRRQLPQEAEDPVIQKGMGSSFALMYLAFASDRMTRPQLTEYLARVIQPRMATIEGVADAQILGAQNFAMRIWLDPILLASRGLTATDVSNAIRNSNFLAAPGSTESDLVAIPVETETTLKTPEAFGELPVRGAGDEVVRLRDVARIELGTDNDDVIVSFGDRKGTFIGIFPTPAANPLRTARMVTEEIPRIQADLPAGMTAFVNYDQTIFINAAVEEVFLTIAQAVLIVIIVIFVFLGSFRSVVIPIVTIPLSLVGVCFFLWLMGFSINLLTLLAMVLAIGLVVDDAIVVVENIHRHLEEGMKPLDAALKGMKEIFSAVVAMSITLAAVYAPIGFTQGLTGALFREFAFALAGAVVISGFIAVTLSPMMSAKLLRPHGHDANPSRLDRFASWVDRTFDRIAAGYARILHGVLEMRWALLGLVAIIFGTMLFLFFHTRTELAPVEDQGALMSMYNGPKYATSRYTQGFVDQFDEKIGLIAESNRRFTIVGMSRGQATAGNSGMAIWGLVPWSQRKRSAQQIQQQIQGGLSKITGIEAFVVSPPALPGAMGGLPIQYVIRSVGSPEQVFEVAEEIKARALKSGRFMVVQSSLTFDAPRARVAIDRDRAAALGVSVADIGSTLNTLLSDGYISKFDRDNRSYKIIPQVEQIHRENPEDLGRFYVRSLNGEMVPLSAVTRIDTASAPPSIEQFNQLNASIISAMPGFGMTNDEGLAALRSIAAEVMPDGFFEDFAGESRLSLQEGNSLAFAFALAVLIIYLVLAAQFESFRDPLIIMMAVPLSIFGALIPLYLGASTLNIYTQIGLITLVGLITKHGILIVQFANARRAAGVSRREAVEEAARVRLRPILMTTAAMVIGVLPLVLASGAGAASRYSIGLVVMAGMSIGTLFTLFVVPMFYTYLSHADRPVEERHPVPRPVQRAAE